MPTARYGYVSLYRLYLANGGSKKYAPVMAAIALAESAGKPNARHINNDGSVDQGLWQINSSNYSGSDIYDPNVNARWAVRLAEHSGRGVRNWTTYTSGKYRKYLPRQAKGDTSVAGKGFGIFTQGNYAGTDQGVDFKGTGPIPALGSGVVTDVGKSNIIEGGGPFPYVIYRLTSGPYKNHYVYIAENFVPTVKQGTRLKTGQEVGKAVGAYPYIEVGFNKTGKGWNPVAPLNPNPHSPKPAGEAMKSYIYGVAHLNPGGGGFIHDLTSGATTALSVATNPVGAVTSLFSGAAGAITSPIANAIDTVGKDAMYAGAILGGGITFVLGLILIAADVGLSNKAGRTAAEIAAIVPAGKVVGRVAGASAAKQAQKTPEPKSNIPDRREQRAEEKHQAQLKNLKARTKATKSQAKNRRKTVKEQKASEQKSYYAGARDAASPTMAKIRRDRKQKRK